MKGLICFDVDGTLTEPWGNVLLPGVREWFDDNPDVKKCLITNQGGVGLRYWMEKAQFGNPKNLPVAGDVAIRLIRLGRDLGVDHIYTSFRYQTKTGEWSPCPTDDSEIFTMFGEKGIYKASWNRDWRKPHPGMIYQAYRDVEVFRSGMLVVGDRPEDQKAAIRAGVDFKWANQFFGRD